LRVPDIECLARWQHAQRGLLPPAAFIEIAEKNGLIDELTLVVLRKAAAQLRNWQQEGLQIRLAVNVSMNSLRKLDLPEIFESIVHAEGVQPDSFVLEITESRLISDLTLTLDVLTRLRLKGFDLAIDDFGTGYSTLENLRKLPFSELKLDRSFVSGITNDKTKRAILESSVRLGKALNLNLVAEGVETREEWDLICAMGCHEVQGYFVTQPMQVEAVSQWIMDWENGKLSQANFAGTQPETDATAAKILVVDNNRHLRDEIVKVLGLRYQTLTAETGEDALMIAQLEKPDLILLDTELPGMDGFATCQQLKEDEQTAHIPVIFLSAYDMLDDKLRGYEAGGADYMSKPGDPLELNAKIEHILALAAQHRQLKDMANYASSNMACQAWYKSAPKSTHLHAMRRVRPTRWKYP
jgi:EAL domain-containing protein (putative c-di-GMP-specific phosphodiesterase class I)/CheY-like chemotaxis protein